MKRFLDIFFHWLPLGVTIVGLSGLVYATVQQNYRMSLNDPQIQMAESGALALTAEKVPADIVPRNQAMIDISQDLAPFIAVYDRDGTPLEASGVLDNLPPKPPIGVFEYAREYQEDRVTWQPNATTRVALVVRAVPNDSGWFVAAGRNMREVESREQRLTAMVCLGLIATLIASFVFEIIGDIWRRRTV